MSAKIALRLEVIVLRSNRYGCEVKGMEVANRVRELEGEVPVYEGSDFMEYAEKFRELEDECQKLIDKPGR